MRGPGSGDGGERVDCGGAALSKDGAADRKAKTNKPQEPHRHVHSTVHHSHVRDYQLHASLLAELSPNNIVPKTTMSTKRKASTPPELTDRAFKLLRHDQSDASSSDSEPESKLPEAPSSPIAPITQRDRTSSPTPSSSSFTSSSSTRSPSSSPDAPGDDDDEDEILSSSADAASETMETAESDSDSDTDSSSSSSASAIYQVSIHHEHMRPGQDPTKDTTLIGSFPSANSANHVAREAIGERWALGSEVTDTQEHVNDGLVTVTAKIGDSETATVVVERIEKQLAEMRDA